MELFDNILSATELGQPIKYFIPTTIISAVLFYWVQNNICLYLDNLPYTMLIAECYAMAFTKVGWMYLCILSHFSKVKRRKFNLENEKGVDTMNRTIFKRIITIMSFESIPLGFFAFVFIRILGFIGNSKRIFLLFFILYFFTFIFNNCLDKYMEQCARKRRYKSIINKRAYNFV